MGMDAEVIVIAPFGILRDKDLLDYPMSYYENVNDHQLIISTLFGADTTDQSKDLAALCSVKPWNVGGHIVRKPSHPSQINMPNDHCIGDDVAQHIYYTLFDLLYEIPNASIQIWYRPNG